MIELRDGDAVLRFDSTLALGVPGEGAAVEPVFSAVSTETANPFGLGDGAVRMERSTVSAPAPAMPAAAASALPTPGTSASAPHPPTSAGVADVEVVRETWRPADGHPWLACRLRLRNHGPQPVEVAELTPLRARGADGLRLGRTTVADWVLLRQPRHKNDMPACVRLGDDRPGVWDAARGTP